MAAEADIATVRRNVNELDDSVYTDEAISALIDAGDMNSASAAIWRQKAAAYSDLYNQSEAGASAAMGDLYKHAKEMADSYTAMIPSVAVTSNRAKVHVIERST